MAFPKIFETRYWDVPKLSLVLGFLTLVTTVIFSIHPSFLFPEEQIYNPEIQLQSTLLPQQTLVVLESCNKSIETDNIEKFEVSTLKDIEKYVYFKLAETGDSTRDILVILADPNNAVRFSSPQLNENQISQQNLANLRLHSISVNRYVKIKLPDLSGSNMEGDWHLNIYVYNSEDELTLVASKPIESSIFSGKNSDSKPISESIKEIFVTVIAGITLIGIEPMIDKIKKNKVKEKDKVEEDKVEEDKVKEKDKVEEDKVEEDKVKEDSDLINPSRFKKLEGLVVDVDLNYGLIKRCPQCRQMMQKGHCPFHGKVKGDYDLYLEAILYDGISEHLLLIKRPTLENYFEIRIDDCIAMAADRLDPTVVGYLFSQQMIGKWFLVKGIYSPDGFNVERMRMNDQYSHESSLILYDRWKIK